MQQLELRSFPSAQSLSLESSPPWKCPPWKSPPGSFSHESFPCECVFSGWSTWRFPTIPGSKWSIFGTSCRPWKALGACCCGCSWKNCCCCCCCCCCCLSGLGWKNLHPAAVFKSLQLSITTTCITSFFGQARRIQQPRYYYEPKASGPSCPNHLFWSQTIPCSSPKPPQKEQIKKKGQNIKSFRLEFVVKVIRGCHLQVSPYLHSRDRLLLLFWCTGEVSPTLCCTKKLISQQKRHF